MEKTNFKRQTIFNKKLKEQDGKCYWCNGNLLLDKKGRIEICGKFRAAYNEKDELLPGVVGVPELDHIISKSWGGADDETNFVLACDVCNQLKGNKIWFKRKDGKIRQYLVSSQKTEVGKIENNSITIKTVITLK